MAKQHKNLSIDKAIEVLLAESKYAKEITPNKVEEIIASIKAKSKKSSVVGTLKKTEYKNTEYFDFAKNLIFKTDNIEHLIKLGQAGVKTLDFAEIEEVVKKSKNAMWCYRFVKAFPEVERKDYEDIIVKSKDTVACTKYAIYCKPADIVPFQNVVSDQTNTMDARTHILYFFKHVEGANRSILGQAYVDTFFDKKMDYHYTYPQTHTLTTVHESIDLLFNPSVALKEGTDAPAIIPFKDGREAELKDHLSTYAIDLARRVELNEMMDRRSKVAVK